MDETSISHQYILRGGAVVDSARELRNRDATQFSQRTERSEIRSNLTLCAFIVNDPVLQPWLPQVLLPRSKNDDVPAAQRAAFQALAPPISVWYGYNGWVNEDVLMRLIRELRQVVRQRRGRDVKILLAIDSATQHVGRRCLAYAARMQVFLILIPGLLTWLLQMLDVYVFRKLKSRLRDLQMQRRIGSRKGILAKHEWIPLAGQAITEVLVQGDYSYTFGRLGFEEGMPNLRSEVRRFLPPDGALPRRPLLDAEVSDIVGRRRIAVSSSLFNGPSRLAGGSLDADAALDEMELPRGVPLPGSSGLALHRWHR